MTPKGTSSALQSLRFLRSIGQTFHNCEIAPGILLTVASGERSFPKLKEIKNYLCTSVPQDRLREPAVLSIGKDELHRSNC